MHYVTFFVTSAAVIRLSLRRDNSSTSYLPGARSKQSSEGAGRACVLAGGGGFGEGPWVADQLGGRLHAQGLS